MYQAALETASSESIVLMLGKYDSQNPAALKRLLGGGTQLRPFPKPVMDAAYDAANELYAEISAKNPKFKKIYDSWVKYRDEQLLWFRVAEGTFDSYMASTTTRKQIARASSRARVCQYV